MARRTNAELSEATRSTLIARARDAFATHGYADAPIDEVVRAAGLTKGALYHHFGSKQGLFTAVVRAVDDEIVARIDRDVRDDEHTREAFLRACRIYLQATLEPGVRRILLLDAPSVFGHREGRALDEETSIRPIAEALHALVAAAELPKLDVEATAQLIDGALYSAALWIGESASPRRALARTMAAFDAMLPRTSSKRKA